MYYQKCIPEDERPISIDKVDIKRIVLPKKDLYGKKSSFKYFIGYINETDAFSVPLYIKLPRMNGYAKYFNDNKFINLLVHDKELRKKCNAICGKINNLSKKEFDREPGYDNKYIKTKIAICNKEINTNFYDNKIPEDDESCTFLSVISLDSIANVDKKYYQQIFLEWILLMKN